MKTATRTTLEQMKWPALRKLLLYLEPPNPKQAPAPEPSAKPRLRPAI